MTSIAILHVAKKQLGMDDHAYEAVLERVTGLPSSKGMTEAQRARVLDEFKTLGFKPSFKGGSKGRRKALEGRFAKKLQALWIAG